MMTLKEFAKTPIGIVGEAKLMIMPMEKDGKINYKNYQKLSEAIEEYGNYDLIQIFGLSDKIQYVIFKPRS